MSDFILLKWRAQQALNTSLSVGGVGACMHGCMSGGIILISQGHCSHLVFTLLALLCWY